MIGALDIGGTHVTAARVDPGEAAVDAATRCRLDFRPDGTRDEILGAIVSAAMALGPVERLGVAVPGPFEYARGISLVRHKLDALYGVDLRQELGRALDVAPSAVSFVNDADAFVLGEWWGGAARGHRRVVGITLGTGLGSGFLADGEIVDDGPDVPPEGSLHLASFRGAPVEDRISRGALLARYGAGAGVDVSDIAERARMGDERARETFDSFARALAEFLAPWLVRFQPTCLVVGGSIARAWDLLGSRLRADGATVVQAANLDDAPLLGAALRATKAT
jgi:glucokinase